MAVVELRLPVTRQDIEDNADDLLPSELEGDQREEAIDNLLRSAQRYESWVQTRDPVEQAELRSRPVLTSAAPDEDEAPAKPARRRR